MERHHCSRPQSTISVDADSLTLNGALNESNGPCGLTKNGAGMLILDGGASYSGATQINAGTLQIGADNQLPAGSDVTVGSGALLDLNGFNQTVASISGAGAVSMGDCSGRGVHGGRRQRFHYVSRAFLAAAPI